MSPKLCDPAQCTGCGACRNACPHDAISLTFDEEGFLSPKIDSKLCVDCKRCENACPNLNPPQLARTADPTVYACWSADADVRAQSSSGGMFSVYANHILARQGVVFGVAYDEKNRAVFVKVENVDELKRRVARNTSKRTSGQSIGRREKNLKLEGPSSSPACPARSQGFTLI